MRRRKKKRKKNEFSPHARSTSMCCFQKIVKTVATMTTTAAAAAATTHLAQSGGEGGLHEGAVEPEELARPVLVACVNSLCKQTAQFEHRPPAPDCACKTRLRQTVSHRTDCTSAYPAIKHVKGFLAGLTHRQHRLRLLQRRPVAAVDDVRQQRQRPDVARRVRGGLQVPSPP